MQVWFKQRFNWIAIVIAAFISLTFVLVLVPGFGKLPDNVDNMRVAVVDRDDQQISKAVKSDLTENLPFKHVSVDKSDAKIKSQIKQRKVSLVVVIPDGFSANVKAGKAVQLKYIKGTANGMIENNAQTSLIKQVNSTVQDQLQSKMIVGMLSKQMAPQAEQAAKTKAEAAVKAQIQANPSLASQAATLAQKAQQTAKAEAQKTVTAKATQAAANVTAKLSSNTETVGTKYTNQKHQIAPMFLNLGQYLGVMIASVILVLLFMSARFAIKNKFAAFAGLQLTGVIMGGIVALLATWSLTFVMSVDNWGTLFMTNWLFDLSVFEVSSMLGLLCAGLPSMVIQLPLFVAQVIAGGAIVPRFAMPSFYKWLSGITPMYQGVQSSTNVLAGIGHISAYLSSLTWIAVAGLIVGLIFVWIGYRGKEQKGLAKLLPVKTN